MTTRRVPTMNGLEQTQALAVIAGGRPGATHRSVGTGSADSSERKTMGLSKMTAANGGDYKNPSPGTVGAVCTRIIDLGTQETGFGPKRRLLVQWEIDELMDDGRPFLVGATYTLSFHEKSGFRQAIEGWRGRAFKEGEGFDARKLLAKAALLNLTEREGTNGNMYINVRHISPLPKGMAPLEPQGPLLMFDMDEPDWDVFEQLSQKMQERIQKAPEFKRAEATPARAAATQPAPAARNEPVAEAVGEGGEPFDDDIPFAPYEKGMPA